MTYKEAVTLASAINHKLLANDPRFSGAVRILGTDDGMVMFLPDAFALKKDKFFLIFAEHYGPFVFETEVTKVTVFNGEDAIPEV